jgi:hypothetical protein
MEITYVEMEKIFIEYINQILSNRYNNGILHEINYRYNEQVMTSYFSYFNDKDLELPVTFLNEILPLIQNTYPDKTYSNITIHRVFSDICFYLKRANIRCQFSFIQCILTFHELHDSSCRRYFIDDPILEHWLFFFQGHTRDMFGIDTLFSSHDIELYYNMCKDESKKVNVGRNIPIENLLNELKYLERELD